MAQKQIKDMAASVRERLLLLAKQSQRSFDSVLRLYCQERFLYRLSISPYKRNFVLKGGLLFVSLPVPIRRPTVDVDFAGIAISDDREHLMKVFSAIALIEYWDGILYHPERMIVQKIKGGTDFKGSRIIIPAELARARVNLQVDVAFGDAIAKGPHAIDFPTLLDLPKPNIYAYSLASMISEKFEAIVSRQTATTRMKDFFDIAWLAESLPFDGTELQDSFEKTFARRSVGKERCKAVFSKEFAQDVGLAALWKGFLARNDLADAGEFPAVMEKIKCFLEPIVAGTCVGKTWDNLLGNWPPV